MSFLFPHLAWALAKQVSLPYFMCCNNNIKTRSLKRRILSNKPHQPDNFQDNSLTPQQFHVSPPFSRAVYEQFTSHRKEKNPSAIGGLGFYKIRPVNILVLPTAGHPEQTLQWKLIHKRQQSPKFGLCKHFPLRPRASHAEEDKAGPWAFSKNHPQK